MSINKINGVVSDTQKKIIQDHIKGLSEPDAKKVSDSLESGKITKHNFARTLDKIESLLERGDA